MILLVVGIALIGGLVVLLIVRRIYRPQNSEKPAPIQIPVANIPQPADKKFKRCPVCESTYTDASLNFCLSDGAALQSPDEAVELETIVRRFR